VAPAVPAGIHRSSGVGVLAGLLTLAVASIFFWQQGAFDGSNIVASEFVETGNCVNLSDQADDQFDIVPCPQSHSGEVVAVIEHPDAEGPYPGDQVTKVWFEESCREAANAYVGAEVMTTTLSTRVVMPSEDDWNDGVHSAVCYVSATNGEATLQGSVRGQGERLRRQGTVAINQLAAGDCFRPTDDRNPFELRSGDVVELTDCGDPHYGVFFGRGVLPFPDDAEFPNADELSAASTAVCSGRFEDFFGVESSIGYTFRFWRPSRTSWDSGSREVLCAVLSEEPLDTQYIPADYPALADLGTGQCFVLLPEQRPEGISLDDHVRPVLCSEPHLGQMIGTGQLPETEGFPGDEEVRRVTESECRDRFETFVGIPPSESSYGRFPYWYPDERTWTSGDTRYACAILGEQVLTESIQNSGG
ncbi:MAG: septum formation family protein, partial [Acidimicrobiia bacterium]|nr:septum formation family protein [Acidimicrobiia bacterium]